ncbi:MAG TPA: hypothetical protein VMI13_09165 [Solirubrobacteraceae bacterium]|nr:hypothetical protein [Solirubrobacteraceae bacterium]
MSDGPEARPAALPDAGAHGDAPADGPSAGTQRYGPLLIERRSKDDGRELIFFLDTREPG